MVDPQKRMIYIDSLGGSEDFQNIRLYIRDRR